MEKSLRTKWAIIGAMLFAFMSAFASASFASTEITNDVRLIKSRMNYDRQAGTSYVNVSLKNISDNNILAGPVRVVIESISADDVTVKNADGTIDGKPYFEYAASDGLTPGQISGAEKWRFLNQKRKRFQYKISVWTEETRVYDSDRDGAPDSEDACPDDPGKTAPGDCGCNVADTDSDNDGTPDCNDECPNNADKTEPGDCGCGVADTDSDNDGTPDCNDECPNNPGKTAPGDCGCDTADTDSDRDGVPNCKDGCPTDRNKTSPGVCGCGKSDADSDGDGVLNCNDGCPSDPNKTSSGTCGCGVTDTNTDSDGDGTIDCLDGCPNDGSKTSAGSCGCGNPDTDGDGDGTADCNDGCPTDSDKTAPGDCGCNTPDTDTDDDGVADCNDECADTPSGVNVDADGCVLINVSGRVRAAGLRVASAQVKIGSETVSTDGNGDFSTQMSEQEVLNGVGGDVLPIEVTADGYATGYTKKGYHPGKYHYHVEIKLIPVTDEITGDDNAATSKVDIEKDGTKIGELDLSSALPAGVTKVTGNVSYIDPTTADIDAFPGNDFLAVREPSQGGGTVTLESLGLMEFDLRDQNGDPITALDGDASVCMKVPDSLNASAGDVIPLWWYNPTDGLWHEEGSGTVEDRGTDGLWMCGTVSHFTWWNYDRPIETHACFKFSFVKEEDGSPVNLDWYAEGVDFSGGAPERPCDCDSDDPSPCPGEKISSLTVKIGSQIKVHTNLSGVRYYLKDDSDGTHSLTTDTSQAAVFDAPDVQGSCFFNVGVENCVPLDGDDGILRLGGINYAPDIISFTVPDRVDPDTTVPITAQITDAEGDAVSVNWSAMCGTITNPIPAGGTPVTPPVAASAEFTAPANFGICKVTLTAQDSNGNTSQASAYVWVQAEEPLGTIEGILYGSDGQPAAGASLRLKEGYRGDEGGDYSRTVTTDANGHYIFDDVPCCRIEDYGGDYYCESFWGQLFTEMNVNGTVWTYEKQVNLSCCSADVCYGDYEGDGNCTQDIYPPSTLWGTLQGTAYDESGNPAQVVADIGLEWWNYSGYDEGIMSTSVPISANGSYGPLSVPVGQVNVKSPTTSRSVTVHHNNETVNFDFGPGAVGVIEGYVYDDNGDPVNNAEVTMGYSSSVQTAYTNASGYYSFSDVSTKYGQPVRTSEYGYFYGIAPYIKGQSRRLDFNGRNATVTGTLYEWDGQPRAGTEIQLNTDSGTPTTTDADGQFTFVNLPTGSASIIVESEDYYGASFIIDENNGTITVDSQMAPPNAGYCGGYVR